ncbi:MAG TPA: ribose 5-phosphate isomerase B [candidate division Zixibacteria bacterium]|nr:ribose 5-phosphate isomerase B [candidate division Zixibacteria bacterium]HEQ98306.1 ribose 5-phosphate isomerase B [candidate division Zixibacteria bacterium]
MNDNIKNIALASDHAGFEYKEEIKKHLKGKGYEVMDFGTDSILPVDYPLFIKVAAEAVALKKCQAGIVLGGSGNGEAMAANKVKGIRCAVCWNRESARLAKEHNNANMISLGQRLIPLETAIAIVDEWLQAEFEGGRHKRRIDMLEKPLP